MARFNFPDHIARAIEQDRLNRLSGSGPRVRAASRAAPSLVTQPTKLVTKPTPPNRLPRASISLPTPSASLPKALSAKTPLQPPPAPQRQVRPKPHPKPRKRQKARPPCNTWRRFMAAHLDDPRSIARNEERVLAFVRLSREARFEIAPEQAFNLPACNYTARIEFARIATDHVTRFTNSLPRSEPVFWVTLIRDTYTVPYDEAAALNLFKLQQWVRAELLGCSFVGMVEAALYTNANEVRPGWKRAISWHTHLLVWGVTKQRMREIRDSINVRFRTLIPGAKPAHFRLLRPEEIEGQALYMMKAPVNEYRIITKMREAKDPNTRKIVREPTGAFRSRKYQLGPGDLTRMANLLAGKSLDGLAFAAGDGKKLLTGIKFEARAAERALATQARGARPRPSLSPRHGSHAQAMGPRRARR